MMYIDQRTVFRRGELVRLLEAVCQSLELTEAQHELARDRYEAVGEWLSDGDSPLLRRLSIYLQGSTAIRTNVKPIRSNEHDVDLVCHVPNAANTLSPAALKKVIGDRLRANGHYAPLLEEKPRCWRLVYANDFHLDITPSIPNAACWSGGELVPDKAQREWKESNPKGYKRLFDQRAALMPRIRLVKADGAGRARADIQPFPAQGGFKGILRRTIQIAKRHRDIYFEHRDASLLPISVIITTLASRSYQFCVENYEYDSEFDLMCDVLRRMPEFIENGFMHGQMQWFIWNEATVGENFAEKWNSDRKRAEAFFAWHVRAVADIEEFARLEGLDRIRTKMSDAFGSLPVGKAFNAVTNAVSAARSSGQLSIAPRIGLTIGAAAHSTPVRANTFFGAAE